MILFEDDKMIAAKGQYIRRSETWHKCSQPYLSRTSRSWERDRIAIFLYPTST